MQNLSDQQRRILLKNPNVKKITEKHVVYTAKFKISAVEQYLNGKTPIEIFEDAQIDPQLFIPDYCHSCLKRWKKKYFEEGKDSLKISNTGLHSKGRPKKDNIDELTVAEMKALIEIQQEVIEMLKKNRALAKKKKEE